MTFRYRHGDRPLDGYTIKRGVGHGGFGEVYYAISDGGREVALKAIFLNHDVELRGVRHCINLKSPHLVSIHDVRTNDQNVPFVIMEYVSGPSLRDLLRENPNGLGEDKAAYLLREIAKGLAYLHEHGIVHRDLKPENIFYEDGFVKIGDYGLSKYISVSRQSGQTMSVGTVHYMAPEIGSGIYSRGIDIYALGVVFYELLTGRVPFSGDSFGEILMKHLTADPDLSEIREPFRSVVRRALAKKPEERYASAEEMARDLFRTRSVEENVSLFNPATLSMAARRAAPAAARDGIENPAESFDPSETAAVRTMTPPPGGPPPIPNVDPPRRAPPRAEPIASPRADLRAAPPPPDPRRTAPEPQATPAGRASGWRTSARFDFDTASAYDPFDLAQRLGRVGFITAVASAVVLFFSREVNASIGLAFVSLAAAAAVLGTELFIGERFRVKDGLARKLVAGVLAFLPVAIGALAYDGDEGPAIATAVFVGILFLDWEERIDPNREKRLGGGHAISAGIVGWIVGLFAEDGAAFVACSLALASLVVNGFAPFVPVERRRELERALRSRPKDGASPDALAQGTPGAATPEARPAGGGPIPPAPPHGAQLARQARESRAWKRPQGQGGSRPIEADAGVPPTPAGQIAWPFFGAIFIAGGISLLVLSAFYFRHREETVAAAGTGVALIAFSGFFFYRGLLARSRTFLGRTVRPFLTALSLAGATGTGAALLRVTTIYEPVPDELLLMTLWGFGCSLALFAFVFTMTRFAVESEKMALAQLPRRARPPNVFVRTCALLLGLIATATAITLSIGAELGNLRSPDRYAFLVSSIACLGGGVFLLQQGLRRARGTIWSGKVRPFLLASAPTIVTIGLYSLTSAPWQVPPDEEVGWIITMIFATVLGIFAGIVPGKTVTDEERATLASITGSAPSTVDAGPVSRGWSALSWIGWTIGTPLVLFAALGSTTMAAPRASGLMANALARADLVALIGYAFSIGGAIAGLLSRSRAPRSHIVRGLFAQSAFLAALASFSVAFRSIHVDRFSGLHMPESDTVELAFASMIVSALLGAVLGAWPARQRSRRAPHSQAPLET